MGQMESIACVAIFSAGAFSYFALVELRAWRRMLTAYLQQRVKKPLDVPTVKPANTQEPASTLALPKDLQDEIDLQEEMEREERLRELRDG